MSAKKTKPKTKVPDKPKPKRQVKSTKTEAEKQAQRLANLKNFPKGVSGNPNGRPAVDPELRMIKNLTEKELIEIGNLVIKGNMEKLKAISKDPEATVIKVMIAAVAVKVISSGDMMRLDVLLNRLVGKVKERVDVNANLTSNPVHVVVSLPDNNRGNQS